MSQENVEIVRSAYEAVKRGDFEMANSLMHPDIEFHTYGRSPEAGIYRGREASGATTRTCSTSSRASGSTSTSSSMPETGSSP